MTKTKEGTILSYSPIEGLGLVQVGGDEYGFGITSFDGKRPDVGDLVDVVFTDTSPYPLVIRAKREMHKP